jgi:hypothetical protein
MIATCLLAAALSAGAASPKDEALLLGLRTAKNELTTYLVDRDGFHKSGDGLAIPRKSGWWTLGTKNRTSFEKYQEVLFVGGPAGKPFPVPKVEPGAEKCEASESVTVLFASSDYFAWQLEFGSDCEGAAHPSSAKLLLTARLEDMAKKAPGRKIGDVLGAAALNALKRDHAKAKLGLKGEAADCVLDPLDNEWALVRSRGRWIGRGIFSVTHVCEGSERVFTIETPIPTSVTGPDALPRPFEALAKDQAGLVDAVASPSGAFLVTVTRDGFAASIDGQPAGTLKLPGAAIVMAQWATGDAAHPWKEEAAQALAGAQK